MENLAMHDRIMDIYRQQAAMGGCGDNYLAPNPYYRGMGEIDYEDMLGDGVLVGGTGPSKKSKAAALGNPWLNYVAWFKKNYDVEGLAPTEITKKAAGYYKKLSNAQKKKYAKMGLVGKKRRTRVPKKKSGSKTTKKKAPKKRVVKKKAPKKKATKTGITYHKMIPSQAQMKRLGVDRDEFRSLVEAEEERRGKPFTKRQLQRIGYFYQKKVGDRCLKPIREGAKNAKYFLDEEYDCEPRSIFDTRLRGRKVAKKKPVNMPKKVRQTFEERLRPTFEELKEAKKGFPNQFVDWYADEMPKKKR